MRRPAAERPAVREAPTSAPPPADGAFVAGETFTLPFRMHTLTYVHGERYTVGPELRALIESSDVRVTWEG